MRSIVGLLHVSAVAFTASACPYLSSTEGGHAHPTGQMLVASRDSFVPYYTPTISDADWDAIRSRVIDQVTNGNGPRLISLAWNNANTWDDSDGSGGSHAQMFLGIVPDGNSPDSANLAVLKMIQGNLTGVSLSDIIAFSGAVAVTNSCWETSNNCPIVTFRPGRADAQSTADAPVNAGFASAFNPGSLDPDALRSSFARLGNFSDAEITALLGAHNLGNCHLAVSGYAGPWTLTPLTLDNTFFQLLVNNGSYSQQVVTYNTTSKTQFIDNEGRMMLFADMALTRSDSFLKYVKQYASNRSAFFADFSSAFAKVLHLGLTNLSSPVSTVAPQISVVQLPADAVCYPINSDPIYCAISKDDGNGNTVYTVHSSKPGWAALGVGVTSMNGGDVIIGWLNSTGGVWTNTLTTVQHAITVNANSAWQQIPLATTAPSWAKLSFSAVHQNVVAADSNLQGNNINGDVTFAVSSYAPASGNIDQLRGVSQFFQHDISGILAVGTTAASTSSFPTAAVVAGISVGIVLIAIGATAFVQRKKILTMIAARKRVSEATNFENDAHIGPPAAVVSHLSTDSTQASFLMSSGNSRNMLSALLSPISSAASLEVIPEVESSVEDIANCQPSSTTQLTAPPISTEKQRFSFATYVAIPSDRVLEDLSNVDTVFLRAVADVVNGTDVLREEDARKWTAAEVAGWVILNGGSAQQAAVTRIVNGDYLNL
ncbi:heme peroxidase [Entophlyctis luteolus]|nr:heme peroxidase [Entophlyctis luteolus]